jgi:hypothetical protein
MRRRSLLVSIAVLALLGGVLAGIGSAGTNAGTVKIFDGDKELPANDPKVCGPFTVRGLNFDPGENVAIEIVGHGGPNAGTGSFSATVLVLGDGTFTTGPISLPIGMYKLDSDDGEGGGDKNKVFKVECAEPPPEEPPPEEPPPEEPPPGQPPPEQPPGVAQPPTPGGQQPPVQQVAPPAGQVSPTTVQPAPAAASAVVVQPRTTG